MPTIGDIRSELIMDSRKWTGGARSAIGSLGNLKKAAVAGFAAISAAALAGVATFSTKVLPQFDKLDQVAKFGRETGLPTEDLLAYGFAAEQTGVGIETMNKGIQIAIRRVGEAKQGYGEGSKALAAMGLSAQRLSSQSFNRTLEDISEGIRAIPDPAERAAAAYALFGRQGQQLLNFLTEGRDGIRGFRAEAEGLGLLFSSDQLAKIENANDAMNRLDRTTDAFWQQLAIQAAPAVEELADSLTELARDEDNVKNLTDAITSLAKAFVFVADNAGKAWGIMRDSVNGLTALALSAQEKLGLVAEGTTDEFIRMAKGADDAAAAAGRLGAAGARGAVPEDDQLNPAAVADFAARVGGLAATFADTAEDYAVRWGRAMGEQQKKLAAKQADDARLQDLAKQITQQNRTPLEVLQEGLDDLGSLAIDGLLDDEQIGRQLEVLRGNFLDSLPDETGGKDRQVRFAGAVSAGSAGVVSAVAGAIAQAQGGQNLPDKQFAVTKEQAATLKQVAELLADLNRKVPEDSELVVVENLGG